ncbi:MAG TPA: Fe-S cluster assembly protein SufB, partial [Anaerolineae bacterium]|nr:Fe-S cluster assembly protein SufB [Anaerolineae bacterium]
MANEYDDLRQLKDQAQGDFATEIDYAYQTRRGLGEDIVREISAVKGEPQWMLDFRLKALDTFMKLPMPTWGADLGLLNFEEFYYFMRSTERKARTWEEVPGAIKDTFERLGIPEAERRYLAGVETQMDSEAVYSSLKAEWEQHGIIFVDMDTAVREYPDLVREHISTVVPIGDNKFAALNSAFWSGGSFVYVPQGVNVEIPLQAYFRINAQNLGQFERTIIIAD